MQTIQLVENKLKFHSIRYGILLILVLFVTHFVSVQKLPFQPGYSFPWFSFAVVSVFGFLICTANWFVYQKFHSNATGFATRLIEQLVINLISTVIIYSILFPLINVVILGGAITWFGYFKYLTICSTIIIGKISILTGYELYLMKTPYQSNHEGRLMVKSGRKNIMLDVYDIAFLYSKNGIISIHLTDGTKYITNYTSLGLPEKELPSDSFFRINRQYIINRNIVSQIRDDVNRKLKVSLLPKINSPEKELLVSRYKSNQFKLWLMPD